MSGRPEAEPWAVDTSLPSPFLPSIDSVESLVQPPPGTVTRVQEAKPLTLSTARNLGCWGSKSGNTQDKSLGSAGNAVQRAKTPRSWPRTLLSVIDQTGNRMVPLCDQDEIVNEAPCKPLSPRLMTEPAACSSLLSPRSAWPGVCSGYSGCIEEN